MIRHPPLRVGEEIRDDAEGTTTVAIRVLETSIYVAA